MATSELEIILTRAEKLSTAETFDLVRQLIAKLQAKIESEKPASSGGQPFEQRGLVYGKYKNHPGPETTEEDFKFAEYHFNEDEWR